MKAVVLSAPGDARVAEVVDPNGRGTAVVRLREVGICGTDLKIFKGDVPVAYPRVLGHEAVGEVVQAGPRSLFAVGQPVLIDPAIACGHCRRCRRDQPHLCERGGLMGRDEDGVFAELAAVDELRLHLLPGSIPWEHGPLLQILGTCLHGQSLVQTGPTDSAVVVGLGVSGLLHIQLLLARGAGPVIGVTRSAEKLKMAQRLGATAVATPGEAQPVVEEETTGEGAALVVECSGTLAGMRTAVELARPGGTVLLFGTVSETEGAFPYYLLYFKELALISTRAARPRDYDAAIQLADHGVVQLAPLLSARFPFTDFDNALAAFRDGALKVTMQVGSADGPSG